MADLDQSRRKLLARRPWIRGGLYDVLTRSTVLHVDAYVKALALDPRLSVLVIEYSAGGKRDVARDLYLISPERAELVQLWDATFGFDVTWSPLNNEWMRRVHASVRELARNALNPVGPYPCAWSRVSLFCHYIPAPDRDPFKGIANGYERSERKPAKVAKLPDIL